MNKKSLRFLCLISTISTSISLFGCSFNKNSEVHKKPSISETEELVSTPTYSFSQNNEFTTSLPTKENKNTDTNKDVENFKNKSNESTENTKVDHSKNNDVKNDSSKNSNPEKDIKEPNKDKDTAANKIDYNSLNNSKISWWFKPNKLHVTPEVNNKLNFELGKYDACYVGDTDRKVLYLTFDEGYENGYTGKILDTLKENDVKAIFFVTLPYLKGNNDLIKRMVDEGHIVANHTNHHPSMPTVTGSEEKFNKELKDVEEEYKRITGKDMPKFFRPPMGEYSEKSLAMTKNLGYKTVFWSFAYHDWDINKQPNPDKAKATILGGLHNGSIMLIHAVSKTNTEILDDILKEAKAEGYVFELLNEE
ncbi:delta-lactam-biosynthetic de-N-acetylase [Clostridium tunisiense]|uniref:delta-lactam-biosynthetic de-N-acetylase n=1 Tax=Clostridium tunisiense TaxID=219748 RepID=UPI0002E869D0|nr:delta-lactam-biosynthetic de-N-acetylase [Clostridium tunisiense]